METTVEQTGQLIAAYLGNHWQTECRFQDINQIPGGASRQTYLVHLLSNGQPVRVIVRRDPPSSLIDTERAHEYNTYAAVFNNGVMPVPQPIVLEETPGALQYPFSISAFISEGKASPAGLDEPEMAAAKPALAQRKWSLLGALAKLSPTQLGVDSFMPTPEHPAAHELSYWRQVIEADALHPQPIAAAALRWLDKHLPAPSGNLCLVHGDFRTGNYLYTQSGEITAVLDWEMAHIGDPLEDLAWSLDPLWSPDLHLAGRLVPRTTAIDIWEKASGMTVDPETFRWWQIFASVKALAIWLSSAHDYTTGTTKEPILAFAGWPMIDRQNRILLDRLSPDSQHLYAEALA
ncbi:MAG: phosphotransferase family protein [Pseudomonadales bacterium]|nr:phosphotransferase family protein [Pseudomonadales bacterium]